MIFESMLSFHPAVTIILLPYHLSKYFQKRDYKQLLCYLFCLANGCKKQWLRLPWIFPFFLQWGKNNKLLTGKKSHQKASFQSFCTVRGDSLVNINLNDVYPAIWRSRWSVNNNDDIVTIINELLKTSARFYIIILNSVQFLVLGKPEVIEMLFSS